MKTRFLVVLALLATAIVAQRASAQYAYGGPSFGSRAPMYYASLADPNAAGGMAPVVDVGTASGSFAADSCTSGAAGCTDGACADCGQACGECCCSCGWTHGFSVFGEALYLRARDSEVTYGSEVNSANNPLQSPPIQVGRIGVVDQDYDPGFRAGFTYVMDECTSIGGTYTFFETTRTDRIDLLNPNNVIQSSVLHPSTVAAATGGTFATGAHDIFFDMVDVDYRKLFSWDNCHQYNWLLGARYTKLEQQFRHEVGILGSQTVATDIDFDGVGLRFGLEGERYRCQWRGYGKLIGNIIGGDFRATYQQGQAFDSSVVLADWETVGRIITQWDLEVGGGWQSKHGKVRVSAGYLYSVWTNVVKSDDFIRAVQYNDFLHLGHTMTFDGLVGRLELRI